MSTQLSCDCCNMRNGVAFVGCAADASLVGTVASNVWAKYHLAPPAVMKMGALIHNPAFMASLGVVALLSSGKVAGVFGDCCPNTCVGESLHQYEAKTDSIFKKISDSFSDCIGCCDNRSVNSGENIYIINIDPNPSVGGATCNSCDQGCGDCASSCCDLVGKILEGLGECLGSCGECAGSCCECVGACCDGCSL